MKSLQKALFHILTNVQLKHLSINDRDKSPVTDQVKTIVLTLFFKFFPKFPSASVLFISYEAEFGSSLFRIYKMD